MAESSNNKIYGKTDVELQAINKNFISLHDEEKKTYVEHFNKVLESVMTEMKNQDALFAAIYVRLCGAGSYFDGLRVAKANEFDMDVVMKLPVSYQEIVIENAGVPPAFVKVKLTKEAIDHLRQHPRWTDVYRFMDRWWDSNGYLLQTKFRTWMEGVVNKALNTFPKVEGGRFLLTLERKVFDGSEDSEDVKYTVSLKKSGPAMTLNISLPGDLPNVDVDLVPVLEFKYPQWPPKPVRQLNSEMAAQKPSWFVVPKPKHNCPQFKDCFWRLAFHDQERQMLHGKAFLKPVCRLLKQFRDARKLSLVASYYIKTIFLWEVEENQNPAFWQQSLSRIFLHMLEKFHTCLKDKCIYYFWDERYNLLESMTSDQFKNYDGNVSKQIKIMNNKMFSPEENVNVFPEVLLSKSEQQKFSALQAIPSVSEERSPLRSLGSEVQNNEQTIEKRDHRDGQGSILQEIKEIMNKMQETISETNEITKRLCCQVQKLEGKLDFQDEKLMRLEDELMLLKQSQLPPTKGQMLVKDFLQLNDKH